MWVYSGRKPLLEEIYFIQHGENICKYINIVETVAKIKNIFILELNNVF